MTQHDTSRAVLAVSGEDRVAFLQGVVTQDVTQASISHLLFGAMLSPQGKFLHDFFLFEHDNRILLDTPVKSKDMLLKRLTMYKLRAKVQIDDVSADWHVGYSLTDGFLDPRHPELPRRLYKPLAASALALISTDQYHQARLALGVPDSHFDITEDDVAMDLGYDLLHAISFTKGCYVGQEVTARMHYKQIARRGFYMVTAASNLPAAGNTVLAGDLKVGTLRGSIGSRGLALLKFGEVAHAAAERIPLTVDNIPVQVILPSWMQPKFALFQESHRNQ